MNSNISPSDIIDFWYSDRVSRQWFSSTEELDREIQSKFESLWHSAAEGDLDDWCETSEGSLALGIILDQFPLNMFRGTARSFSSEAQAIKVAKNAVSHEFDRELDIGKLQFLYMPLMHSETIADQELSVKLFTQAGLQHNLSFARHHREIVQKFGRFPHRNEILGRQSTQEELDDLNSEDAFKGQNDCGSLSSSEILNLKWIGV